MFVLAEIESLKFIQGSFANFKYKSVPETLEWRGNIQFNPFNLLIPSEIHIRPTLPINFNEYLTQYQKNNPWNNNVLQLWNLGDGASVFQRRALYEARRLRRREKPFILMIGYGTFKFPQNQFFPTCPANTYHFLFELYAYSIYYSYQL